MYQHRIVEAADSAKSLAAPPSNHLPHITISAMLAAVDFLSVTVFVASSILIYAKISVPVVLQLGDIIALSTASGGMVFLVLLLQGRYQLHNIVLRRIQLISFLQAWGICILLALWAAFLTKTSATFSRGAMSLAFGPGFLLALGCRMAVVEGIRRLFLERRLTLASAFLIYAGDAEDKVEAAGALAANGIAITGLHQLDTVAVARGDVELAAIEAAQAAQQTLLAERYDTIYLAVPWVEGAVLARLLPALSRLPLPVLLLPDGATRAFIAGRRVELAGTTAFEVVRPPLSVSEQAAKRMIDVTLASVGLILLLPLLVLVALGVWVSSGRPILFRQMRRGFGGRTFGILKFRTMRVLENGAEVRQAERNDPRVTPFGALLRRSSLDELPQLWNVLRGDMSLVGPRPHALAHDNHYDALISTYAIRQHVKPGITGWAQVNGHRGETREVGAMEKRVEHDLWYISHFTLWLDIRILLRTAILAFFDKKAY